MPRWRRAGKWPDQRPGGNGYATRLAVLPHALTLLGLPRILLPLGRPGVTLSRGLDVFRPAKPELVLRAGCLATITPRADAELLAADAAEPEPTNRIFDGATATAELRDQRVGADPYRVRSHGAKCKAVHARAPTRAFYFSVASRVR